MKNVFVLLSALLLLSCSKPLPELQNIDTTLWKEDRNGCNGSRKEMIKAIRKQKDELLKLTEIKIVQLLGRPDGNELYERNQKFYYYNLSPGKNCGIMDSTATQLEIRFNAMGIAKEVQVK
jgi:outer membrane protein assembly factor BamE (lipoprotein component of BamABCDE complex)